MLKIGTCISFSSMETLEEKLQAMRDNGFTTCQLLSWKMSLWTDENAARVKELFEKYGVTITAFWCGWREPVAWDPRNGPLTIGIVPPAFRYERMNNLEAGADFAHKLGVRDMITHMGFIPENPNDPDFAGMCVAVRRVAKYIQNEYDMRLLFETGQETPMAILRCFETVDCDNLGVNLDTANLITYGKANPVDALDTIGKYVCNVHAKDGVYPTSGFQNGHETPIGEGKVDFHAFIRRLKELGYDGPLTIEREISGNAVSVNNEILAARDYLQNILNEVYGG